MSQHDDWKLRQRVYLLFVKWQYEDKVVYIDGNEFNSTHFSRLCGRDLDNQFRMGEPCTEAEREICKNLLGPHGYTYYRALMAIRGIKHG